MASALTVKPDRSNRNRRDTPSIAIAMGGELHHLSGGEQRRVAIARGYLKPFDLLLADEPTGSLDEGNRDGILSILDSFHASGKTVIIVSHDPVVAAHCGRTVHIGDEA